MQRLGSPSTRGPRAIRWSFVIAAGAAISVLIGISTIRETYQGWKVNQEIQGLQAQVDAMEGKKLHLNDLIQKIQSPDALDKEARLHFGLRKPGERVVIINGINAADTEDPTELSATSSSATVAASNPQKWFRYFFVHLN